SVVHADISARTLGERNRGGDHQPCISFGDRQQFVPSQFQYFSVVMPTTDLKMGRTEHVHPQLCQQLSGCLNAGSYEQAVLMPIRKNRLVEAVAAFLLSPADFKS